MTNFVNSSALTKLLANLFIFVTLITLLAIGVYDTVNHLPLPDYITTVLGSAIGYALSVLGVHLGSSTSLSSQNSLANTTNSLASPTPTVEDDQATQKMPKVGS